ncbi:MAG: transporter substrate-binding domain-containing protein [Desulfobacterales bacterium]|nr:transporter substrate-binding domain-containing protein [Desulfobacterales bacterium]MBF0395729.1 transporter substrate-binding domain-containing protein [Desulfobacterales bacterium]
MKKLMFTLLLVFLFSQISFSEEKKFVIGVENLDYLPYQTVVNNDYQGFARELLDLFAQNKGYKFTYRPTPVKRLFIEFLNGEIDFKYPDNPNWKGDLRKGINISYSNSIVNFIDGVMVLPERKEMKIDGLKTLGTVLGFTPWDYLDLINSKSISLQENPNIFGLLQMVILKRIDGAYVNIAVANYQLETNLKSTQSLTFASNLPHTKGNYFVSSIKHPEILKEINQFLEEKKEEINNLKKKYKLQDK